MQFTRLSPNFTHGRTSGDEERLTITALIMPSNIIETQSFPGNNRPLLAYTHKEGKS